MTRRRLTPTEHDEQATLIKFADIKAKQDPRWGMLVAIPNEGGSGRAGFLRQKRMKAEGQRAGFPDLILFVSTIDTSMPKLYYGLAIEMKSRNGRLRPEQKEWLKRLEEQGYKTAVCHSFEEAKKVIEEYLS